MITIDASDEIADAQALAAWSQRIREETSPTPGSIPYENHRTISVAKAYDRWSVADFLAARFPHISANNWAESCSQGRLSLRGCISSTDDILRAGDVLLHKIPNTTEPDVSNEIRFIYEDSFLVVLDKPAPLPIHPCGRFNKNTLTSFLKLSRPQFKPHVVHRLDSDTTGLIIIAKSKESAAQLVGQFCANSVRKHYLARVHSIPARDKFSCKLPVSPEVSKDGVRELSEDGLSALTEFELLENFPDDTALLMVTPVTGRTNQIRLHLESLGHPIVGDHVYNGKGDQKCTFSDSTDPLHLHALSIRFTHPHTGDTVEFESHRPVWAR